MSNRYLARLRHQIETVFHKELIDGFRDRRSLMSAFAFALFGPLVIGMALGSLAQRADDDRPLEVRVVSPDAAPALVDHLRAAGTIVVPGPSTAEELEAEIVAGTAGVGLVVDADFGADLAAYQRPTLTVIWDDARSASTRDRDRLVGQIAAWERSVATTRLVARGVSPVVTSPVELRTRDLSTPQSRGAVALAMLPIFLLMSAFVGGMATAIDVTAGERERGSLESLLLLPVGRGALATGKWLAATVVNAAVVAATLATSVWVVRSDRLDPLQLQLGDDPRTVGLLLALLLPLALFGPAVQMVVALFSKSFKEAQTYLSLLVMAPALPGFVFAFKDVDVAAWMRVTPVIGQQVALTDVLRGETLDLASQLALAGATTAVAVGCVIAVARLLRHERLVVLG